MDFEDDILVIKADNFEQKIIRDDTFGLSEYFFYDGETLERVDMKELLYDPDE